MLDNELREQAFPDIWDATLLAMIWKCPRSFYWFLRRVDYAGDNKPSYFSWGSAFQEALTRWYELSESARLECPEQSTALALTPGLALWDSEGLDQPPLNTRAGLIKAFEAYTDFYPTEPWHLVEGGGELGWTWPIAGTPYSLGGSLDGYIEWPGYGTLILENKTSGGYLSDSYISQWSFSTQITNYIWYLTQLVGTKAFGCLVNMITKNIPGPKSKWKTPRFTRVLETRSEGQLNDFIEAVCYTIERARAYWDNWYFPKTLDHVNCAGGPGISACKMRRICLSEQHYTEIDPPATNPTLIYRPDKWEPWARKGEQT